MTTKSLVCLGLSSLLLSLAFCWPSCSSWLMLLCSYGLVFFIDTQYGLSSKHIFLWLMSSYLVLLYPFIIFIPVLLLPKILIFIGLVASLALSGTLLFCMIRRLAERITPSFSTLLGLYSLVAWQEYFFLSCWGVWQANPLLNPLIVFPYSLLGCLASFSIVLGPVGAQLVGWLIFLTTAYFLQKLVQYWPRCSVVLVAVLLIVCHEHDKDFSLDTQVCPVAFSCIMPQVAYPCANVQESLDILSDVGQQVRKHNAQVIIFPESFFDALDFTDKQLIDQWYDYLPADTIIIAGWRTHNKHDFYTSAVSVAHGNILDCFNKTDLLAYGETTDCGGLFKSCLTNARKAGTAPRRPLGTTPFIPYLCSELFCAHKLVGNHEPLLALVNDSWWHGSCLGQLMYRKAGLQALLHRRIVLYCSYHYRVIFDAQGKVYQR